MRTISRWLGPLILTLVAWPVSASFHLWVMNELYSNADGSVQFLELSTSAGGQELVANHVLTATQGATTRTFMVPTNLPGDSTGRRFLFGTQGFAALGVVTPDYIVPNGFFFLGNGTVNWAGVDNWNYSGLPSDGSLSLNRDGSTAVNSPQNFAGQTGTVVPPVVQRAFVKSSGSDGNTGSGCGLAAPCRSFASAQTVVKDGGEIVALDAAGYGPITVTKNVTITANPGFYAGIAVASGDGVTIATGGINVTLRGLNINGTGGANAVNMTNGSRLSIENCVISNFASGAGVFVNTAATVRIVDSLVRDNMHGVLLYSGAKAAISGSKFLGNANTGVYVGGSTAGTITTAAVSDSVISGTGFAGLYAYAPDATATARIAVASSTISNNANGVVADVSSGITVVTVTDSMVTGNTTGLSQVGTATLELLGNNTVRQNGTDTVGTITTVSPM
jgi:hypothetical protein